jgi:hypothetical protein
MSEVEMGIELGKFSLLALVLSILVFLASLIEGDATLWGLLMVGGLVTLLAGLVLCKMAVKMGWRGWSHRRSDK